MTLQFQIRHTGVTGAARNTMRIRSGRRFQRKPLHFEPSSLDPSRLRPIRPAPINVKPIRARGFRIVRPVLRIRKG